jgi:ABC-type multidrug transport system fused ATPase/permease subunit
MFSSAKEVRSYGVEGFFSARISTQAAAAAMGHRNVALLPQIARIVTDQGVVLLFLCVVIVVELRHGDVRQLLSLLLFYFVLSRRLLPLISQISFMAGQMESSYGNVQMIASELNECSVHRAARPAAQKTNGNLLVELEHVSFAFQEGVPLLRSVNLCLHRGETVRLRGRSGCGKSSLLSVIAGVLQPSSGTIRIDRTRVAYVPQDVILLDESIRNNLLFGRYFRSDAALMHALATANLEDFVAAQPLGLDTEVGDNGIRFSGGQRQRLGLARAIVGGATLLLLDEATSALDEETESKVLANLRGAGVAVLLVTHRSSQGEFAQRVFRLEHGCLIEESIQEPSFRGAEPLARAI